MDALHNGRQSYIKSYASTKIKQTLKQKTSTYSNIIYKTSNKVYYKKKITEVVNDLRQLLKKWSANTSKRSFELHYVDPCNSKLRKSNTATTDLSVSDRKKRLLKLLMSLDSGEI